MRVSREKMAENRLRILDEAGRLFRAKGFDSVSVAEVMKAAGQTHGGFYGHFSSKDDLVAQTLAHLLGRTSGEGMDLHGIVAAYLSSRHCDNVAAGCPIAALAADVRHQTPEARHALTEGLKSQISRLSAAAGEGNEVERRRLAFGSWSAMVGAVILSRAIDDPLLAKDVLEQTRGWIDADIDRLGAKT